MDQQSHFGGFGRAQQAGQNPWNQGGAAQGSYANVGFTAPQQSGFPQTGGVNPAMPQPNGYAQTVPQQGGYAQTVPQPNGYAQPQMPQANGYAPQMPQPGGYAQAAPQQGPFGQATPQQGPFGQTAPQQPAAGQAPGGAWPAQGTSWQQNGGQPWPEPIYNGQLKRRRSVRVDSRMVLTILACAVMPLLLVAALVIHTGWLTILTAALAVGMLTTLWLSGVFERPTNIMISVLYAAALVVAIILTVSPPGDAKKNAANTSDPNGAVTGQQSLSDPNAPSNPGTQTTPNPGEEDMGVFALQEEENNVETDASVEVVDRFLSYWQANLLDSMVNLCSRSWSQGLRSSTTPKAELFQLLRNRTMLNYEFDGITGSINDQRRTASYYADMYPPGSTTAARYLLKVDVVQEDGRWYVDPRSMESNAPTPTPTAAVSLPTQPPDPPPAEMSTVLYYNPDGGKLYHLDAYCPSVDPKYTPLGGRFTYAEINDRQYKNLTPCTRCGAPIRYN